MQADRKRHAFMAGMGGNPWTAVLHTMKALAYGDSTGGTG
jgi:hypothetical protein